MGNAPAARRMRLYRDCTKMSLTETFLLEFWIFHPSLYNEANLQQKSTTIHKAAAAAAAAGFIHIDTIHSY